MYILTSIWVSLDSSVGIATGYGLERPKGGVRVFQTSSGVHPVSYPKVTWGYVPGGKVAWA
jgi:hypothetical protein